VTPGMTVDEVSGFIRGKEGSVLTLVIRKPAGYSVTVRLVRARLPGSKTVSVIPTTLYATCGSSLLRICRSKIFYFHHQRYSALCGMPFN
jgi:hypothetical protein